MENLKSWNSHTADQKTEIEKFLCHSTEFNFHKNYQNKSVGIQPFSYITEYTSNGEMIKTWTDGKIRVNRFLALGPKRNKISGTQYFVGDIADKPMLESIRLRKDEKNMKVERTNIKQLSLIDKVGYLCRLEVFFLDENLKGLTISTELNHFKNIDDTLFSNWKFENFEQWNTYYESIDRIMLAQTYDFKIGEEHIQPEIIFAYSTLVNEIDRMPVAKILGISYKWGNITNHSLNFEKVGNTDEYNYLKMGKNHANNSGIFLNVKLDFN